MRSTTPAFLAQLAQHELLHTNEPGTFAFESYTDRLPELVRDTAARNAARLSAEQLAALEALASGMQRNAAVPLPAEAAPAEAELAPLTPHWTALLAGKGYTWQNAPWFLTEQYMFHLVLLLAGYYSSGIDPFHASYVDVNAEDDERGQSIERVWSAGRWRS